MFQTCYDLINKYKYAFHNSFLSHVGLLMIL